MLGETSILLRDMLNWKVGTKIVFNTRPEDELEMRCGHFPMFKGPVGQKQDNIAVRIEKYIQPKQQEDD